MRHSGEITVFLFAHSFQTDKQKKALEKGFRTMALDDLAPEYEHVAPVTGGNAVCTHLNSLVEDQVVAERCIFESGRPMVYYHGNKKYLPDFEFVLSGIVPKE
jgi:hypothetical protein